MTVEISRRELTPGGDVGKPDQRMHNGQLTWVIKLQPRDALTVPQHCRFRQLAKLATIDEGFQDVLLDVKIVVNDRAHRLAELGQVLDRFLDAIVGHVVAGGFSAKVNVIAHVLLDEPVAVVAANHRIGQVKVFDHRLEFTTVMLGHLAAENHADLVGLSDRAIGIE